MGVRFASMCTRMQAQTRRGAPKLKSVPLTLDYSGSQSFDNAQMYAEAPTAASAASAASESKSASNMGLPATVAASRRWKYTLQ